MLRPQEEQEEGAPVCTLERLGVIWGVEKKEHEDFNQKFTVNWAHLS